MERDLNPNSKEAAFVEVTSSTKEDAIFFLEKNNNNVNDAVSEYFAFKGDTSEDIPHTAQGDTASDSLFSFGVKGDTVSPSDVLPSASDEAGVSPSNDLPSTSVEAGVSPSNDLPSTSVEAGVSPSNDLPSTSDGGRSGCMEVDGLSYGTRPVRIYWDLENTSKPDFMVGTKENKKIELSDIHGNITQAVRASGMLGSIKIYSYAKKTSVPDRFKNIRGVKFKPVDDDYPREAADAALTNDVLKLLNSKSNQPTNIILISGDADFSSLLSMVKQKNWTACIVYPGTFSVTNAGILQALAANCDLIWKYEDFLSGDVALYSKLSLYASDESPAREYINRLLQTFFILQKERVSATEVNLAAIWEGPPSLFESTLRSGLHAGKICKDELKKGVFVYRLSGYPTLDYVDPKMDFTSNLTSVLLDSLLSDLLNNEKLNQRIANSESEYAFAACLRDECSFLNEYPIGYCLFLREVLVTKLNWMASITLRDTVLHFEISTENCTENCTEIWTEIITDESTSGTALAQDICYHYICEDNIRRGSEVKLKSTTRSIETSPIQLLQDNIKVDDKFIDAPVGIFWDYDSAPFIWTPDNPSFILANVVDAIRLANMNGFVDFELYIKKGNYPTEKRISKSDLWMFENWATRGQVNTRLRMSARKKGRQDYDCAETQMPIGISEYIQNIGTPANLILVTRNGALSSSMKQLKQSHHNLILVLVKPKKEEPIRRSVSALTEIADLIWFFTDFTRGVGLSYKKGQLAELVNTGEECAILDEVGRLLTVLHDFSCRRELATLAKIKSKAPSLNTLRALEWAFKLGKIMVGNPWSDDSYYQERRHQHNSKVEPISSENESQVGTQNKDDAVEGFGSVEWIAKHDNYGGGDNKSVLKAEREELESLLSQEKLLTLQLKQELADAKSSNSNLYKELAAEKARRSILEVEVAELDQKLQNFGTLQKELELLQRQKAASEQASPKQRQGSGGV